MEMKACDSCGDSATRPRAIVAAALIGKLMGGGGSRCRLLDSSIGRLLHPGKCDGWQSSGVG